MLNPALVPSPVCFLAFAGLTKAAQMPFHTWLLGAMVAPTPTSALLHSSTMVKAGVFLLIKLAPLFTVCVIPAQMVILVGGITFMLCSFMAISQTNAKRVLAYSTIANLGLITACAGVATPEAIWAAILLVIFHAAAKSLLFLCVGTAEHHIGSRDIEDMDLLFERMPRLARFMMLGIMCMFIAPFGMLIAKWATLVSFVDSGQMALVLLLAFGSAATFMFWGKWLGKLSGIAGQPKNVETTVHPSEWISLALMAAIALVACIALPLMSNCFRRALHQGRLRPARADIAIDNLWISSILAVFVFVVLFGGPGRSKRKKRADVYLAGVTVDSDARISATACQARRRRRRATCTSRRSSARRSCADRRVHLRRHHRRSASLQAASSRRSCCRRRGWLRMSFITYSSERSPSRSWRPSSGACSRDLTASSLRACRGASVRRCSSRITTCASSWPRTTSRVSGVDGVYMTVRARVHGIRGRYLLQRRQPADERVHHHDGRPVLHHGRLLVALSLCRARRWARGDPGDVVRADGAAHGRVLLHGGRHVQRRRSVWADETGHLVHDGPRSSASCSSSPSSCASRRSTCRRRIMRTRSSYAARRPR